MTSAPRQSGVARSRSPQRWQDKSGVQGDAEPIPDFVVSRDEDQNKESKRKHRGSPFTSLQGARGDAGGIGFQKGHGFQPRRRSSSAGVYGALDLGTNNCRLLVAR
ncbi:MAG: hypothetical protein AAGF15_12520, partial [Pseudomonadota bacterium]